MVLYYQELMRLVLDAMVSVETRHISGAMFYDFSGGSFGALMGVMECESVRMKEGRESAVRASHK